MGEFIPYKESFILKGLGLNESCFGYYTHNEGFRRIGGSDKIDFDLLATEGFYNTYCIAPLYQQAFRWFRKSHNIHGYIDRYKNECWQFFVVSTVNDEEEFLSSGTNFKSFEEAEHTCLIKMIELIKKISK